MGCLKNDNSSNGRTSLYDRVKKLLVSCEWSDCSFTVSGKVFKAHKLILSMSSPVFEAMFFGPLSSNDVIEITDIPADTFQLLINYIYTDTADITSIEQAFELLYASTKYLLDQLSDMCISYIQSNISIDNVIDILNYSDLMHDEKLMTFSLKFFCEHAKYLLQEKINLITYPCMKAILESDEINVSEKELVKHVFQWTLNYCEQNDIPPTYENRHNILSKLGLLKLLRFLTIKIDDFEEICSDTNNLLTPCEAENIRKMIKSSLDSANIENMSNISIVPRNLLKLKWFLCFRSPLRSMPPITIDSNNYTVYTRMRTNKSVWINSVSIPTKMAPAISFRNNSAKVYTEHLSVAIVCDTENSDIKSTNFTGTVEYNSMVNIELNETCFIEKDKWYKISFMWPPHNIYPSNSYAVEFRDKLYTDNRITFEFDDLLLNSRNGGSFLGGLKYCL